MSNTSNLTGGATQIATSTTAAFLTTLYTGIAVAVIVLIIFLILRPRRLDVYETRSAYDEKLKNKLPELPGTIFGWIPPLFKTKTDDVFEYAGSDQCMYISILSYGFMLTCAMLPLACCILIPTYGTSSNDNVAGIAVISIENIPSSSKNNPRYSATAFVCYAITIMLLYMCYKLWVKYVDIVKKHKAIPVQHNYSVIVKGIPTEFATNEALFALYNKMSPGKVKSAVMVMDVATLTDAVAKRDGFVSNYENAMQTFIDQKINKKTGAYDRPSHKAKMFCGEKRDSIDYYRGKIEKYNKIITDGKLANKEVSATNGFVTFTSVCQAQMIAQSLNYSSYDKLESEVAPAEVDVYWSNMSSGPKERSWRKPAFRILTIAMILLWTIPIGAVQSLVSIQNLSKALPGFVELLQQSPALYGFVSGLLPVLVVTIFMALLVPICAWLAIGEGSDSISKITMNQFGKLFYFNFWNVFLVSTVSSSILQSLRNIIEDPTSTVTILGQALPLVATFFVDYIIILALNSSSLRLLNIGGLILNYIFLKMAKTDRNKRAIVKPYAMQWAVQLAEMCLVFCLVYTYTPIQPLITVFGVVYFAMSYWIYKYQVMYCFEVDIQSGAALWPRSFKYIIISMVTGQVCWIGLLLIRKTWMGYIIIPLPFLTIAFYMFVHGKYYLPGKYLSIYDASTLDETRALALSNPAIAEPLQEETSSSETPIEKKLSKHKKTESGVNKADYVSINLDAEAEQEDDTNARKNSLDNDTNAEKAAAAKEKKIKTDNIAYTPPCMLAPDEAVVDQKIYTEYEKKNQENLALLGNGGGSNGAMTVKEKSLEDQEEGPIRSGQV